MSYDLIVWKSPRTTNLDEFHKRLDRIYGARDETAFDASADVLRFYDDLLAPYPALESYGDNEIDSALRRGQYVPDMVIGGQCASGRGGAVVWDIALGEPQATRPTA